MASGKKSFIDRFSLDSRQKAPGSRKTKKNKSSKSLSRELNPPSQGRRYDKKSNSDTIVADLRAEERNEKNYEEEYASATNIEAMDIDEKPVHIDKLDPSLTATWTQPDDSMFESACSSGNEEYLPVFESPPSNISATTAESRYVSSVTMQLKSADKVLDNMSGSSRISSVPRTFSTVSSCYSSDSLAGEMESYRLGASRSSSNSDVDTLKNSSCADIDISQCSSTSTPIKFGLFENELRDKVQAPVPRNPPPKFSLIKEVAHEDHDNLSTSLDVSGQRMGSEAKSNISLRKLEELSDDSDSSRLKSAELSDDPEFHPHAHFVPLNKQLQIVTSMEKLK